MNSSTSSLLNCWKQHSGYLFQLLSADEAILVSIEDLESLPNCVCIVVLRGLLLHQFQELWKFNRAVAVEVDLKDHVEQLVFSRVLPHRPHHAQKLFVRDGSASIRVKLVESLLKLGVLKLHHRGHDDGPGVDRQLLDQLQATTGGAPPPVSPH